MGIVYVVGAGIEGQEGFSARALSLVRQARVLYGAPRLLELFGDLDVEKVALSGNDDLSQLVKDQPGPVVVLTSGDPLFFSIGRNLLRNLPKDRLEFVPNVSSVQSAFSRIKEPWDDAVFISTEQRTLADIGDRIIANDKAAVLTDARHTPANIADELLRRGFDGYTVYLCENLGTTQERIVKTTVQELPTMQAAELNVLILIKRYDNTTPGDQPTLGIADGEFLTMKKQITPEEVRVVALAKLQLRHDMVLWDIGAGSGSISIEADFLLPHGRIFAVERNIEYIKFLRENLNRFHPRNVRVVEGEAPSCLEDLPDPDRVFIGGSGGNLWELLEAVDGRLPADGRVVLTAMTLDTLVASSDFFGNSGYLVDVTTLNVARTSSNTDYKVFEAHNPVYIIVATKAQD
ncbi:bifunctional cobalt-precorrin-7 (C(5))-methyltransferase/cobalt-precorrin-6B (C(15))-methyltransferase [Desulfuromonas acetoxidans]|uniref:Precorrin-6y C5,15-methyltransferase, subunit CbiE n=1 Tax=Desulfuromonas acetoxidans (strain DSM 684 / 11070) TaxID=281689 RepID=Q1JWD1_DESA6|nr:bifunctional cobalt-precorrin-7 (C(5))-methyltransferase/cobalt-precorrin-6B (C(15))-methyltransferase [Desulfuromonas acetoxidans]EAT14552.1 Precorrin-6y C5,15-methyltransferase, subunit CbiE [Desulfuromonas acetoxidans DSM 684]MBF0645623.1 bifunctional cobalt-precorrin-7 (C(5))-methyltransferase/cobalt-precorrin-6B (C(15))-methyltransferase [Desulfuromonas acetoxidans]NVD24326.1 bifunctional cobalt-precorrin-7 (C(5))-methyltransferase/cobalt-precorrin-6B (C(15))-methyltransferase [Desulfuro